MLALTQLRTSCQRASSIAAIAVVSQLLVGCVATGQPGAGCATESYVPGGYMDQECAPQFGQAPMQQNYPMDMAAEGCSPEGCDFQGSATQGCSDFGNNVPRELRKVSLHDYRIEPPDVLLIEAANNLRPANDRIEAGETLIVQCDKSFPSIDDQTAVSRQFNSVDGPYVIGTDGYLNLGPKYGKVLCAGQTLAEIQRRTEIHLKRIWEDGVQVQVTLPDPSARQAVAGQHLVRPDGSVGLGIYGGVRVAGMTLSEAKFTIEQHLRQHMHNPQVSVDVLGYNSKYYYVIADGGGAGNRVYKLPSTGNETVLDAIAQIKGLPTVSNSGNIWVARPSADSCNADQVLHVDWDAISMGGDTSTNYQLFPGDRLYVQSDCWVRFDTNFAKITAPLERVLGFAILGTGAVRGFNQGNQSVGNNGF